MEQDYKSNMKIALGTIRDSITELNETVDRLFTKLTEEEQISRNEYLEMLSEYLRHKVVEGHFVEEACNSNDTELVKLGSMIIISEQRFLAIDELIKKRFLD